MSEHQAGTPECGGYRELDVEALRAASLDRIEALAARSSGRITWTGNRAPRGGRWTESFVDADGVKRRCAPAYKRTDEDGDVWTVTVVKPNDHRRSANIGGYSNDVAVREDSDDTMPMRFGDDSPDSNPEWMVDHDISLDWSASILIADPVNEIHRRTMVAIDKAECDAYRPDAQPEMPSVYRPADGWNDQTRDSHGSPALDWSPEGTFAARGRDLERQADDLLA